MRNLSRWSWMILLSVLLTACPLRKRSGPTVDARFPAAQAYNYGGIRIWQVVSPRDQLEFRLVVDREPDADDELSWLSLETALRGGAGDWDAEALADRADLYLGKLDFAVEPGRATLRMSCAPGQLGSAWELWMACLTQAHFDPEVFEELRNRRLEVLEKEKGDATYQVIDLGRQMVNGSPKSPSMESLTAEACQRHFQTELMVKSRLTLVVVGKLEGEALADLLMEPLERLPEGLPAAESPQPELPEAPRMELQWLDEGRPVLQAAIPAPGPLAEDRIPFEATLKLLAWKTGELFDNDPETLSNLRLRMVRDHRDWAQVLIGGYRAVPQAERWLSELRRIRQEGMDKNAWEAFSRMNLQEELARFDSNGDFADCLADLAPEQTVPYPRKTLAQLAQVSSRDVQNILQTYFVNIQWSFAGDTSKIDRTTFFRF